LSEETNQSSRIETLSETNSSWSYANEILSQIENQLFDSSKTEVKPDGTITSTVYGGIRFSQTLNQKTEIDSIKTETNEKLETKDSVSKRNVQSNETNLNQAPIESKKETTKQLFIIAIIILLILTIAFKKK
jgi:hypothetical protein